ncbi:hypothetical protein LINPERHAP1_LOCUS39381, partial [Linum perenne]
VSRSSRQRRQEKVESTPNSSYSSTAEVQFSDTENNPCSSEDQNGGSMQKRQLGENISRKEKNTFLVRTVSICK